MTRHALLLFLLTAALASSACLAADDIPVGVVTRHAFESSKIFPGT